MFKKLFEKPFNRQDFVNESKERARIHLNESNPRLAIESIVKDIQNGPDNPVLKQMTVSLGEKMLADDNLETEAARKFIEGFN